MVAWTVAATADSLLGVVVAAGVADKLRMMAGVEWKRIRALPRSV